MGTDIFVVETTDDILLGTIEFVTGGVIVRDGFVGRPYLVDAADVVRISLAEDHPLVYILAS